MQKKSGICNWLKTTGDQLIPTHSDRLNSREGESLMYSAYEGNDEKLGQMLPLYSSGSIQKLGNSALRRRIGCFLCELSALPTKYVLGKSTDLTIIFNQRVVDWGFLEKERHLWLTLWALLLHIQMSW